MASGSFNPRTVLRQTSNGLLDELFGRMEVPMKVSCSDLAEMDIEPIFEAYQSLGDSDHDRAEVMLRDLYSMTGEEPQRVIFQQVKQHGMNDLLKELEQQDSRYDMAVITYLEAPEAWQAAMRFAKADHVVGGRSSQRRVDLPPAKPLTSPEALNSFANAISAYYSARQGRGRHCHVEYALRKPGLHYLFVSLDDYRQTFLKLADGGKRFERRCETHAFENVFVYDEKNHYFDIYARGGKPVHAALQPICAREFLGIHLPPEDPASEPFMLSLFLDPKFTFPTLPQDGIDRVVVKCARIKIRGTKAWNTMGPDEEYGSKALQKFIDSFLREENLPRSLMELRRIELKFYMADGKHFSFAVSKPNAHTMKQLTNTQRALAEKCLLLWGVTRASDSDAASAA
ncbi:hypothetical protein [Crateriforma conspicua]|uniref:Uncharacterized protein n=1 Tax=Crateriforma conspicua TaxID=2527996 RepID=A0A5C6FJY6_9PLAN|nr:hypothetical protein [Crateriforma conspicua]TWU62297.1 hypothetical protein V7x_40260 [Crateriforma conspicua]